VLDGLDRFYRKAEAIKLTGLRHTAFHELIRGGRFPPPDCYLGPRTPVWLESTLREWQREKLTEPKPVRIRAPRSGMSAARRRKVRALSVAETALR
jgi:predicted DNA-binding transcriptional regulator AlpA